jgi:4-amino-4-deoxy-L-arabinose transferase-like glycosyltransferase
LTRQIIWLGDTFLYHRLLPGLHILFNYSAIQFFGLSSSRPVWRIDNFYSLESYRRIKWKPDCIDIRATCVLFSALLRINALYQPNSFDVLSWTVLYFILIKYIKTEDLKWLYVGAIAFAIGFLNKYNIVFLLIGVFPSLLITKHRKIF